MVDGHIKQIAGFYSEDRESATQLLSRADDIFHELTGSLSNTARTDKFHAHGIGTAIRLAETGMSVELAAIAIAHQIASKELSKIPRMLFPDDQTDTSRLSDVVDAIVRLRKIEFPKGSLGEQTTSRRSAEHTNQSLIDAYDLLSGEPDALFIVLASTLDVLERLRNPEAGNDVSELLDFGYTGPIDRQQLATDLRDWFAPIAHILDIGGFIRQFEDDFLEIVDPEQAERLASRLRSDRETRQKDVEQLVAQLSTHLQSVFNVQGDQVIVEGRAKHLYSIYRKLKSKEADDPLELTDLQALRVVFRTDAFVDHFKDSIPEDQLPFRIATNIAEACYQLWKPVPGTWEDYTRWPRGRGYRALHIGVRLNEPDAGSDGWFDPDEAPGLEIQIKSRDWDRVAEYGELSHAQYKMGQLRQEIPVAFVGWFDRWNEFFAKNQIVLNEKSQSAVIPWGSTVLDAVYEMHDENAGTPVTVDVETRRGKQKYHWLDMARLPMPNLARITPEWDDSRTPDTEWLSSLVSNTAKQRVIDRTLLVSGDDQDFWDNVERIGKQILHRYTDDVQYTSYDLRHEESEFVKSVEYSSPSELYREIAGGKIDVAAVARSARANFMGKIEATYKLQRSSITGTSALDKHEHNEACTFRGNDLGLVGPMSRDVCLSPCCDPVRLDPIKFRTPRDPRNVQGIHHRECPFAQGNDWTELLGGTAWNGNANGEGWGRFQLETLLLHRPGMLMEMTEAIQGLGLNIERLLVKELDDAKPSHSYKVCQFRVETPLVEAKSLISKTLTALDSHPGVVTVARFPIYETRIDS